MSFYNTRLYMVWISRRGLRVARSGCLVLLLVALQTGIGRGTTYYVAPNGENHYPGTLAQPWKTVGKAAATLIAGDTVFLLQGIYAEQVLPANSGTASAPITYAAYPGEEPVIDGGFSLSQSWSGVIYISGKAYITLSGLKVIRAGPHDNNCGILVEDSNNIKILSNFTDNTASSGIGVWNSQFIEIDKNQVKKACNDGEQESITVAGTTNFTVSNNHVHHNGPGTNGGEGIDIKDGSAFGTVVGNLVHDLSRLGIYVDAWDKHTHDIQIMGNTVYNCANDGIALTSEQGGLLENVWVINNIVYNSRFNGVAVTPNGDDPSPPLKNIYIVNNTLYQNGDASQAQPWGGGILVDCPDINTLHIKNNIVSDNLLFQILIDVPVTGLTIENNLIDGFRSFQNETAGNNPVLGGPLFMDAAGADFHLKYNSPAIDAGVIAGAPTTDYDLETRPQGQGVDLGAFEFRSYESLGDIEAILKTLVQILPAKKPKDLDSNRQVNASDASIGLSENIGLR